MEGEEFSTPGATLLMTLTKVSIRQLTPEQLVSVGAAIRSHLLGPIGNGPWTIICRALQFFRDAPNVPEDLRTTLSRDVAAIIDTNLACLSKKQVDLTRKLALAIKHLPTTGMPSESTDVPISAPAAPPVAPLPKTASRPPTFSGRQIPILRPSVLAKIVLPSPYSDLNSISDDIPISTSAPEADSTARPPSPPVVIEEPVPIGPPVTPAEVLARMGRSSPPPRDPNLVIPEMLDVYNDNSFSHRCQLLINGINRATASGEICCLLTGECVTGRLSYSAHIAGKKVRNLQKCNPHLPISVPTKDEMLLTLKICKEFMACMRPINAYVDHFTYLLKADYAFERAHQLQRYKKNDEWERFRLQNEGNSYFKMKVTYLDGNPVFAKEDDTALGYSYFIYPGQSVWVSPDDAQYVDPDNKNITATGEVLCMTFESLTVKGLALPLPATTNGLYRVDWAVTTVNLERMSYAVAVLRQQHELNLMRTPEFLARIPSTEQDQATKTDHMGILEPGTLLSQFIFHNIRYSVASARQHYRVQFGATPPPGLPDKFSGFNSYERPPPAKHSIPLNHEEINHVVRQPHPLLVDVRAFPLENQSRPLSRMQHNLNDNQMLAVSKVIDQQRQLTLIQGPPGTGKTTTAIAIICEWVMRYNYKVLATAHSNKGVDNLLQGLVNSGIKVVRVGRGAPIEGTDLGAYSLETLVDRHPMMTARKAQASQEKGQRTGPQNPMANKATVARAVLKEAEVVCATCIGVGSPMVQGIQFELVLVDEATQAIEPAVLIPMTRGARQVVMIGDQAQLPPTCKCPETIMMGLDVSMFDRLIGNGVECHTLETQYRMHPTISCFPSWRFYKSLLHDGVTAWDRVLPAGVFPTSESRVCFLEVDGQEEQVNTSKVNRMEASCVVWMIQQLMAMGSVWFSQIGVITPYSAQVRAISQAVRGAFGDASLQEIEIHSVDGFQGREKDFIILSMVRSKIGGDLSFITDWRRSNVGLTRAKYGVVVVGKALALCQSSIWLDWLKFHHKYLLNWDPWEQRLFPIHPAILDHINSRMSPGEVRYSLDEMLTYKMWLSSQGQSLSALPAANPLPPPSLPKMTPLSKLEGFTGQPPKPPVWVDVDAEEEELKALKRAANGIGIDGQPPVKRIHISDIEIEDLDGPNVKAPEP